MANLLRFGVPGGLALAIQDDSFVSDEFGLDCCCEDEPTSDICHGLTSCGGCADTLMVSVTNRWYFPSTDIMDIINVTTINHRVATNWCVWGGVTGGADPKTEVVQIVAVRYDNKTCKIINNPTYFVTAATLQCVEPITNPDLPHKWSFTIQTFRTGDNPRNHCFAMDNMGPCPVGVMDECPRPGDITTDCAAGGLGACWTTTHQPCFEVNPTAEVFP